MEISTLPILLFAVIATVFSVGLLGVGRAFGPSRTSPVKEMPYESGMDPIHDARRRFRVRFHLVAVAFLLFDVELLFLYPWAVASRNPQGIDAVTAATASEALVSSRHMVFGGVMVFLLLLVLGFVYDWRKGLFRWR
jgi:NADH-quinone oxidoreductase subunit A